MSKYYTTIGGTDVYRTDDHANAAWNKLETEGTGVIQLARQEVSAGPR